MRVLVTGGHGMVGRAVCARLTSQQHEVLAPTSRALDLRDPLAVDAWFAAHPVDAVAHVAARNAGLGAKLADPVGFLNDNLGVATHAITSAQRHGVQRLVYIGSACVYPHHVPQPMAEDALFTGPLEPANEGYALAKICGMKLCQYMNAQHGTRYLTLHPCNLLGPHDHFDPQWGQVVPSLLVRFHRARLEGLSQVEVWGTGRARREFLFVDDLAEAVTWFLERPALVPTERPWLNTGKGDDVTIADLAALVAEVTGYAGKVVFDASKPDGMPRRYLDSARAAELGWTARTSLREALQRTYAWYVAQA